MAKTDPNLELQDQEKYHLFDEFALFASRMDFQDLCYILGFTGFEREILISSSVCPSKAVSNGSAGTVVHDDESRPGHDDSGAFGTIAKQNTDLFLFDMQLLKKREK